MKILSLSDIVVTRIYSPQVRVLFQDVDLVLGCGDLPYYYLEFIASMLDVPVYFVRGNHAEVVEYQEAGPRTHPHGTIDLHCMGVNLNGLLFAGIEGSIRYRHGPFQYSQSEMWSMFFNWSRGFCITGSYMVDTWISSLHMHHRGAFMINPICRTTVLKLFGGC